MAVGRVGCAVVNLSVLGDGALDSVEVFADFAADRDANAALLERGAEARVEFGFQGGGELAEFDFSTRNSPHPGPLPEGLSLTTFISEGKEDIPIK